MTTKDKYDSANKTMIAIVASLIIIVSIFIAIAYTHTPLETPNTTYKTKTYVVECAQPDETIKDFVNCLSEHNKLLKNLPTNLKVKAVKHDYSLLLVNGKARSVGKYLIFDLLNESEFAFNQIQIKVINKNSKNEILWEKIFSINNLNLQPESTDFVEVDAGGHLNNFEWSIIHLK